MLHTVVIDAEALAVLDQLFIVTGKPLPRSAVVDRTHSRAWHAVPIDETSIAAIEMLRRSREESFNDTLRRMFDMPPLPALRKSKRCSMVGHPSSELPLQNGCSAEWSGGTLWRCRSI